MGFVPQFPVTTKGVGTTGVSLESLDKMFSTLIMHFFLNKADVILLKHPLPLLFLIYLPFLLSSQIYTWAHLVHLNME